MMEQQEVRSSMASEGEIQVDKELKPSTEHSSDLKVSPRYSTKVADICTELSKMTASLQNKDIEIMSLRAELSEKGITLMELETELEKGRESERKLLDSLEETKILVEELKSEIASLKERLDGSVQSQDSSEDDSSVQESDIEALRMELESMKENLADAQEVAETSFLKLSSLTEEMGLVKNELKLATEAEITSKKAMDDLALALKEVATDCTQAKQKLEVTEVKLEAERLEAKQWKEKTEAMEENYETLLKEARKDADLRKNTSERLRIEAEESLLAWNGKEAVFVNCIKRGEDEKNSLIDENNKLLQALTNAENLSKKAKDENQKLRDILKHAINEANVAKEAGGIARAENSQLKDALMDKEEELHFALQEIDRSRLREAVANEDVKTLKRLLSEAESKETKADYKEKNEVTSCQNLSSRQNSTQKDQEVEKKENHKEKKDQQHNDKKEDKKDHHNKYYDKKEQHSFSLKDLKISHSHEHKDTTDEETKVATNNNTHEGTDEVESEVNSPGSDSDLFKGSIFDVSETPHAATTHHHRRKSSLMFLEDGEPINSDDLENLEGIHLEEGENYKGGRKKKAFIRRFGDLLVRRKSFTHKKEPSSDQQEKQQTPPPTPPQLQSPEH